MLSLLLNYDVFKCTRRNFMSHWTIINVLTITMAPLRLLNMYTTVKDFVTCFS